MKFIRGGVVMPDTIKLIHETSNLSWITTALVTFVLGVASIIYNMNISKKTQFISTVTTERIRWMTTLKEYISEYYSTANTSIPNQSHEENRLRISEMLNECNRLKLKIILYLNPNDDAELINEIKANYELLVRWSNLIARLQNEPENIGINQYIDLLNTQFRESLENILTKSQTMLKKEWERIKMESENGKLNANKDDKYTSVYKNLVKTIHIVSFISVLGVWLINIDVFIKWVCIIFFILYNAELHVRCLKKE